MLPFSAEIGGGPMAVLPLILAIGTVVMKLSVLMNEVRECRECEAMLPHEPRPLLQGSATSRLLIVGQAPGASAHASGIPWDDPSGRRLRSWLGLTDEQFYDEDLIAILPMGLCFPGRGRNGDLPPRPECAPRWHASLLDEFRSVRMTIYVGRFAVMHYLSSTFATLTAAVSASPELLPDEAAFPHPSPRNNHWLQKHPWFEGDVLPIVQCAVKSALFGD